MDPDAQAAAAARAAPGGGEHEEPYRDVESEESVDTCKGGDDV